jgi:hypothetical protein
MSLESRLDKYYTRTLPSFAEPGETVRVGIFGITSRWIVLFGPIVQVFARRDVIVTDRNVYMTRLRLRGTEVVAKHTLGTVKLSLEGHRIHVGSDNVMSILFLRKDFKRIAQEVVQAANEVPAPPPANPAPTFDRGSPGAATPPPDHVPRV